MGPSLLQLTDDKLNCDHNIYYRRHILYQLFLTYTS